MVEAGPCHQGQGVVEVGVGGHQHRRGAAVLEGTAGARGQAGAQGPAHPATADEGQEAHPRVRRQALGQGRIIHHQGLAPGLGQAGLPQQANEAHARQGGVLGGLDDHRTAGGDGRAHLMDDEVQGMIEGGDGHHHAHGLAVGEGEAPGGGGVDAHGHLATALVAGQLGTVLHAVDGPRHLHPGIHQGLAALPGRLQGQPFGALLHQRRGLLQHRDAPGPGQPAATVPVEGMGGGQGPLHIVRAGGGHAADGAEVIGRRDLQASAVAGGAGDQDVEVFAHGIFPGFNRCRRRPRIRWDRPARPASGSASCSHGSPPGSR